MTDAMAQLRILANPDRLTIIKAEIAELCDETHWLLEGIELFGGRVAELNARRGAKLDEWSDALDKMERSHD